MIRNFELLRWMGATGRSRIEFNHMNGAPLVPWGGSSCFEWARPSLAVPKSLNPRKHVFPMKLPLLSFLLLLVPASGATGQPAAPRLIVRGDDMGFSHSANEAIIQCYKDGIMTSVEVLVPSPWFPEAVKLLAENPGLDVGVHLTLTSEWETIRWRPVSRCPSLVDAAGYLYPMVSPNKNYPGRSVSEQAWSPEDIEREFRAQIELARKHFPNLSHLSSHMGCTDMTESIKELTRRLAHEYHLGYEMRGLGVEGVRYLGPKGTAAEKKASFLRTLESLRPGKTYLFVDHPGLDDPELRAIYHIGYESVASDRAGVTATWTDPEIKAAIKRLGIELVSYRQLVRSGGTP